MGILVAAVLIIAVLCVFWWYQKKKSGPDPDLENILNELDLENRKIGDLMLDVETLDEETGSDFSAVLQKKIDRLSHVAPRYREILEMYMAGEPPGEIARKMGLGVREVQLIIKLYRKEVEE